MKNIYSKVICALLLLFIFSNVYSQFDYRKGYIVTNNYDTIHGFIEYANIKYAPYSIHFRKDSLSNPVKYTPKELTSVNIQGSRYYVSKEVTIYKDKQQLFLEYLLDGVLDLYFMVDITGKDFYFIEKDGEMMELSNESVDKIVDGKAYQQKSQKYIGALNYLMQETPELRDDIKSTAFNHKSLIKITEKYHNAVCDPNTMSCIDYTRKQEKLNDIKWNFKLGLHLGYQHTIMSFSNHVRVGTANYIGYL